MTGHGRAPHPDGFAGRRTVLATRHGKEAVIRPVLEPALGVTLTVPTDFDSDRFGTFDGERARPGTQLEAARAKACAAAEAYACDLAVASEGSFAPDPVVPWVTLNIEAVVLVDRRTGWHLAGMARSHATNHGAVALSRVEAAVAFAETHGFPDHGMLVLDAGGRPLAKGVTTVEGLTAAVTAALAGGGGTLQTDMRAMMNPTRLAVIAAAAADLACRLAARCPSCGCPGFGETWRRPGLPCGWCGRPTRLAVEAVAVCEACGESRSQPFPVGPRAGPETCDFCNP